MIVTTTTFVTFPYVVRPGEGTDAPIGQLAAVHKVPAYVTEQRVAVMEHMLPPRRLAAPRHRHSREDELTFVLEGTLGVLLGDAAVVAEAGAYVYKPRGQWHAFWNEGQVPLRCIEILIPGGIDAYFEQLSGLLHAPGGHNRAAIERLAIEYGIEFDFDGLPTLCKRFDVTF